MTPQDCRVELWGGAGAHQFFLRPVGGGAWAATGRLFEVEPDRSPEDSPAAKAALTAFVAQLEADGWRVTGHGQTVPWDVHLVRAGADDPDLP